MSYALSMESAARTLGSDRRLIVWVFFVLLLRSILALSGQAVVALILSMKGNPAPALAAAGWWTVYGTAVDIGCLLVIGWLLKREGLRIADLVGFQKKQLPWDILKGIGILAIVFPVVMVAGGIIASLLAYGSLQPPIPDGFLNRSLPVWAVIYSRASGG